MNNLNALRHQKRGCDLGESSFLLLQCPVLMTSAQPGLGHTDSGILVELIPEQPLQRGTVNSSLEHANIAHAYRQNCAMLEKKPCNYSVLSRKVLTVGL